MLQILHKKYHCLIDMQSVAGMVTAEVSSKSQEMLSSAQCKNVQLLFCFCLKVTTTIFFLGYQFTVAYYHYKVLKWISFSILCSFWEGHALDSSLTRFSKKSISSSTKNYQTSYFLRIKLSKLRAYKFLFPDNLI